MKYQIKTEKQRSKIPAGKVVWNTVSPKHAIGWRAFEHGGVWKSRNGKIHTFKDSGSILDYQDALKMVVEYWAEDEKPKEYTLQDAVDDYCKHLRMTKPNRKAETGARRTLEGKLPSNLMQMQLSEITISEFEQWRDSIVKSGDAETVRKSKASCNRIMANLRAACNRAHRSGKVDSDSGWRFLESYKGVAKARDRLLSDSDINALLTNSEGAIHLFLRFLIDTGCRVGEARDLDRTSVDWNTGMVTIIGKTGRRVVMLGDTTMEWLRNLPQSRDGSLLANDDGFRFRVGAHSTPVAKAAKAAGLPGVVAYHIRHWYISTAVTAGIPAMSIARRCGNSTLQIEKSYFHAKLEDERDVFSVVGV